MLENIPSIRGALTGISSGVISVWTGVQHVLAVGRYLSTRPTLADGYGSHIHLNQRGDQTTMEQYIPDYEDNANDVAHTHARAIPTSTGAWTASSSGSTAYGAAIPAIIKASAGRVRRITVTNGSATAGIAMIKNKATAMVAADTPDERIVCPATSTVTLDFGISGRYFSTGIAIGFGEVPATADYGALNLRAADDMFYTIEWI